MNVMKKYLILICMFAFSASIANAASLIYNGKSDFQVGFQFNDGNYSYWTASAGQMSITMDGFTNAAFCIEIGTSAKSGSSNITTENPNDYWTDSGYNSFTNTNNGLYAAWLMDQYTPELGSAYLSYTTDMQVAYAALQLAIWETIYDFNGLNYDTTDFFSPMTLADDGYTQSDQEELAWAVAKDYTDSLESVVGDGNILDYFSGKYNFFVADFDSTDNNVHGRSGDGTAQELLIAQPVPEPATMLLFGIGLLGITAVGRRKNS